MNNKSHKASFANDKAAFIRSCAVVLFAVLGLIFFLMSYTTGYYALGEMKSVRALIAIVATVVIEIAVIIINKKFENISLVSVLTVIVTVLFIISFILLIGDRIEGIGFTVVTKFDAGHGGEEACYLSFAACGCFLIGCIINIVGSFLPINRKEKQ